MQELNDKMNIYKDDVVYPSSDLLFLNKYATFKVIGGCYGVDFDFEFDEDMTNKKIDGKIPYFGKWVGVISNISESKQYYMNGDKEYFNNMAHYCNDDTKIVYDAGTVGRYYLGGEARNNRIPLSTRGLLPKSTGFFDPSPFKVVKTGNKVLLANIKNPDTKLELGCLHVHSKRIPRSYQKLIQRLIGEGNSKRGFFWRLGRPDFTVTAERVATKIHKLFFFTKSNDVRFR
jgi:hypothetical protein